MKKVVEFYVEFYYPGMFVSETNVICVTHDEFEDVRKLKIPDDAYSCRRFTRVKIYDGDDVLKGDKKYIGGEIFFGGELLTYDDAISLMGKNSNLVKNMKNNNFGMVIKTKFGQYFPFDNGEDLVI